MVKDHLIKIVEMPELKAKVRSTMRFVPKEIWTHDNDWQEVDLYRDRYRADVRRYER